MAGSTISSTIGNAVTLGYGAYLSPLSITAEGKISNASGYGILISDIANATVVNSGSVIGGSKGIYLEQASGTLVNQGLIAGNVAAVKATNFSAGQVLIENSGTLTGGDGIAGQEADIANSGVIYGSDYGLYLEISTVANTGTIAGGGGIYSEDGMLTNHGDIEGRSVGISLIGGIAVNDGSISGTLGSGARVGNEVGGGGETTPGSLTNYGSILGGIYGVYTTGGFTNEGGVAGRIGLGIGIGGSAGNAGAIYGSAYGAELFGRASMLGGASLTNTGAIAGGEIGVTVGLNGNLLNSGYIYGPNSGVAVYDGYLTNSGSILNATIG